MYLYCDQILNSNIPLPELSTSEKTESGVLFSLENTLNRSVEKPGDQYWLPLDADGWVFYCKTASSYWLRFPSLADFCISNRARKISCFPHSEIPDDTIRHLLLDLVLPFYLAQQGKILVHASAVRLKQGLLIFIGESGAGKSTLAGHFHQAGQPTISDDSILIKPYRNQIRAIPSYGGLRLWPDSLKELFEPAHTTQPVAHYTEKKRVQLESNDLLRLQKGLPILALIVLSPADQDPDPEISLTPLSSREAFIELAKQSFQLDMRDSKRTAKRMQILGEIVPRFKTFRLHSPHDYSLLDRVRQLILDTVLA
jgi:energy-coupling factor transporter ATP-binding protein EcfA2